MTSTSSRKTILITGASSGIGLATALHFQRQGWNVAATVRAEGDAKELSRLPNVFCPVLDVTKVETIRAAVAATLERFGGLDVLLNNAGYGLAGPFESTTPEQIQRQFDTNVFGLMAVTRAVLPHFRSRSQGLVINVASMGGRLTVPLYSIYHSSKWAVEGFTESLSYELELTGIRVKLIEPGAIRTSFYSTSADQAPVTVKSADSGRMKEALSRMNDAGAKGSPPELVARVIYGAATDGSKRLRYVAGQDAKALLALRWALPFPAFARIIRSTVMK